ncbi:MAG: ferritin-like domain-containing protein [Janthinobacterium lividum]
MKIQSVQQLMTTALTYVLDLEEKIGSAAPQMAEASSNPELKELFSKTATKSKEYAGKVEEAFGKLGEQVQRNNNHIVNAMITEVLEMIKNTDPGPVRDSALIVAANQQQLFRVASYGSLESYAKVIGKQDAAKGLTESLEDSKGGDKKFTELAESTINQEAAKAGQEVAA